MTPSKLTVKVAAWVIALALGSAILLAPAAHAASSITGTPYGLLSGRVLVDVDVGVYGNGTLYGTTSYTTPWTATAGVQIGRGLWNASQEAYTNATIDDVHFWSHT